MTRRVTRTGADWWTRPAPATDADRRRIHGPLIEPEPAYDPRADLLRGAALLPLLALAAALAWIVTP